MTTPNRPEVTPTPDEELYVGVYGIWSQNRDLVYVGSSTNLPNRKQQHKTALSLGGTLEVVLDLTGMTQHEVFLWEDRMIVALRAKGIRVVNGTNAEQWRQRGRETLGKVSKEQLRANSVRGRAAMTTESRREAGRKSWATREQRGNGLNRRTVI